ncbi:hypothetical protein UFOVP1476_14 [uncultured Caudovirales phage]|uniref:Uncharacterized protein n=1 Tax=uncultured Caudovirales phage TaxID=2100421 RepID=A0A6J5PNB5_9CAUD|nr:hypothetical protein UFOVP944_32 [uncultured Caudovirales phage]CAB4203348.1 hypothetical protein UFOVP1381_41 [uncultured Caudovirales phage]CAB4215969.1 hypothetical protein UFOVP1476_14 [uncultured Caudovirales phage]
MKNQNSKGYTTDGEMADRLRILLAPPTKQEVAEETAPVILIGDDAAAAYFKQLERDEAAARAQA